MHHLTLLDRLKCFSTKHEAESIENLETKAFHFCSFVDINDGFCGAGTLQQEKTQEREQFVRNGLQQTVKKSSWLRTK